MTTPRGEPDNQPTGISLPLFMAIAAVLIIGAFAAVWYAIPGPDTEHVLTAPSGTRTIELGELCGPGGCTRVAVLDVIQPDASHLRTYCPIDRTETTPLFAEIVASWSPTEDSVTIAFTSAQGEADTLTIQLAECTRTR